jgi:hypothetical protein
MKSTLQPDRKSAEAPDFSPIEKTITGWAQLHPGRKSHHRKVAASARSKMPSPEGPGFSLAVNPTPKGASALPKAGAKPEGRSDPIIAFVFAVVLAFAIIFCHFPPKNPVSSP